MVKKPITEGEIKSTLLAVKVVCNICPAGATMVDDRWTRKIIDDGLVVGKTVYSLTEAGERYLRDR